MSLRTIDAHLLGIETDAAGPGQLSFLVQEHLCRTDGRFYGGAALAAALAMSEHATGREALWSATQLVATAALGERIVLETDVVASGRSVDQVAVRGLVDDRLIFNAVGSAATAREDGIAGAGQRMPRVPRPEDCETWRGPMRSSGHGAADLAPKPIPQVGHHLVSEHRDAPLLDEDGERPGRMALWARMAGDRAPKPSELTPAVLGFLADMIPIAICRACGVEGAGTSLDNSLRLGAPADSEWVLLELDGHIAVGGYGHGQVHLWSPDGRMLATGSQSASLFSLASFMARRDA